MVEWPSGGKRGMVEKDIHACFNGMLMVSEGDKVEIIRSRPMNEEPETMRITEIRNLSAGRHSTSWEVEGTVLSPILRGIVKNISVVTKLGSTSKDTVTRFDVTDITRVGSRIS